MITHNGFRVRSFEERWYVETGWDDGGSLGLWHTTERSVLVNSEEDACGVREAWLVAGIIEPTKQRLSGFRPTGQGHGMFRIRSELVEIT